MKNFNAKLFPVGALTSKPYAFRARSWELEGVLSVDIFDGFGSSTRLDVRGARIMRIIPRVHDSLNEEWITDRVRFSYDGFSRQRLVQPMLRKQGALVPTSWVEAFSVFAKESATRFPLGFMGRTVGLNATLALKSLIESLGGYGVTGSLDYFSKQSSSTRSGFISQVKPQELELADYVLLVGVDLRSESPLLDLRLRRAVRAGTMKVGSIGFNPVASTYNIESFSTSSSEILKFLEGRSLANIRIASAKKPVIILGSYFKRSVNIVDIESFSKLARTFSIQDFMGDSSVFEAGVKQAPSFSFEGLDVFNKNFMIFSLFSDNIRLPLNLVRNSNLFAVYQGSVGDKGALFADLIFPAYSPIEEKEYFLNFLGELRSANSAVPAPVEARSNISILNALKLFCSYYNPNVFDKSINTASRLLDSIGRQEHSENLSNVDFGVLRAPSILKIANTRSSRVVFDGLRVEGFTRASKVMAIASRRLGFRRSLPYRF